MNRTEIIQQIKALAEGITVWDYIVVSKDGECYTIVGRGIGEPIREEYAMEDMIFLHDRDFCSLDDAEDLLDRAEYLAMARVNSEVKGGKKMSGSIFGVEAGQNLNKKEKSKVVREGKEGNYEA